MRVTRLLLVLALALAGPALAGEGPYLGPAQVNLSLLLPPPPEDSGPDMREVLALQQARTPERAELAVADVDESIVAMFGSVLGESFTAAALPLTTRLFDRLGKTENVIADPAKRSFARRRPFMVDASVHPVVPESGSGSYPSGHSTRSTMDAIVLAAMVPERRTAIFARQLEYAQSRVIGGAHYPSDVAAGMRAGTAIAAVLLDDAGFKADFEAARAELRTVLGLAP